MKKKLSVSSQPEKRRRRSGASTRRAGEQPTRQLTATQRRDLAALAALPDDQIDTRSIPEIPPDAWKRAVRGKFYRPVKQAISLRLDADIIAWLKRRGKGYQTRANDMLRQQMLADLYRSGAATSKG